MNFLQLPAYQVPGPLNFSPLSQALESNQQNALAQRRLNLEDQRFGLEKQRFGLQERDSNLAYQNALARKGEYDKLMSDPNSPIARDPTIAAAARIAGYENAPSILVQGRNADLERQRIALQARLTEGQLAQIKMQTPDWRMANAQRFGLDPNSEEGRAFVITGQYAPKSPQFIHTKPGETTAIYDPTKRTVTPIDLGGSPTQSVFDNKYAGENAPKLYDESTKSFRDSMSTAQSVDDLMTLSKYAATGWGSEGVLQLRKMASTLGIPASEKIAPTELFRMLTQKYVLSEGQKLKPMSNTDVAFVEKGLATIASDPSSLPVVLPALQQEALRNARYHQLAMQAYRIGKPADPVAIEAQVDKEMPSVIRQMFGPQQGQQGAAPPQAGQPGQQPTQQSGAPAVPQFGALQPGTYNWTPQGPRPVGAAPATSESGAPASAPAGPPSDVQRGVDAMNRRRAAIGQPEMPPPPQTPQVGQRMAMDAIALRDGKMPPQAFVQRYANAHRQGALPPAERAMYEEIVQALNRRGSP